MFSLARRFALRFSTALLFGILNALFTMTVLSGQWLTSAAGDITLLAFEAAVVVLALLLVQWLIRRAGALAQAVGTVRRGSPEEAQADRVLARFNAAETLLDQLWMSALLPVIAGFFLLDTHLAMYLHGGLLVLAIAITFWQGTRLDKLRNTHGYHAGFGRTTP